MARQLATYEVPCNLGGLNHSPNIDKIPPEAMVHPSRNLNLHEDGRGPRGGTSKKFTGYGGAQVMGQYDFILQNGAQFLVIATADGKIWQNETTTIKTGLTADKKTRFEVLNNVLYMYNSADVPQVWDGVEATTQPSTGVFGTDISFVDGVKSTGTFTLTDNPADGETIIINGTTFTFKTTPTDETIQFEIKGDKGLTADEVAANLTDVLRGGSNATISVATYASDAADTVTVTYATKTSDGNAYTLVVGTADATVSGATLTGGLNAKINRVAADFISRMNSGFKAGQVIKVVGSTSNDGSYTIEAVAAGTLTLIDDTTLTAESAGASIDITWGVPADWTGISFPAWAVKHGRGLSERLWVGGCPDTPNTIYASKLNDGVVEADFSDAQVHITYVETGNDGGLKGAVEFGDRLIMFSSRRTFLYDDSDTNTANWGYSKAQFEYGIANFDLAVKTPNDLIGMMEDGTIYSVNTADTYGDYQSASLTRPAYIDRWIQEYIDLSKIDQFHAIYDPKLRAIKFFMVYKAQARITMALVYFIDRGPMDGWIPHDNQIYSSGYAASASCLYKAGAGDYKVLTGDYNGNVWELETANKADGVASTATSEGAVYGIGVYGTGVYGGNGFYAGFRTPYMTFGDSRRAKHYVRGWILCQFKGDYSLTLDTFVDSIKKDSKTIDLSGGGAVYGTAVYGTATYGGSEIVNKNYGSGYVGRRIQREFSNSNTGEDFFISSISEDFKTLGSRPI